MLQVPSVEEITSGRTRIDALRPVAIEELLGPGIAGQVVLVSGAGGSIGAELCRQILALRPRRLVLLERSEPSLYGIDQELRRSLPAGVELVIQAAVLARGGDLFLLDMGEPVRILDLAKQMVRLSGLSLRDAQHPEGDIEIVCTGLRPGEKLYEELLIDAESEPTSHPLIFRATERAIPPSSSGLRSRPWRPPFAAKTPMPPSTCWPSWCPSGSGVRLGASPSRPIQWRWLKTEACGLFSRSSLLLPNLCVYAHKIDIVHFPCVALVGSLAVAGCRRGQSSPKA